MPLLAEINFQPAGARSISSTHLRTDELATFKAWQTYLTRPPADAVFILGDLFEVWVAWTKIWAGAAPCLKRGAQTS
jgi:UDP-2,3-diacylglucosamine hydrolase